MSLRIKKKNSRMGGRTQSIRASYFVYFAQKFMKCKLTAPGIVTLPRYSHSIRIMSATWSLTAHWIISIVNELLIHFGHVYFILLGIITLDKVFYNLFNIYFLFPTVWFWLKSSDLTSVIVLIFILWSLKCNLIRIHEIAFGVVGLEIEMCSITHLWKKRKEKLSTIIKFF